MLLGLMPNAEGRYAGTIYKGDNGKSYDVAVWSEDASALTVRGCMMAVFCGSQSWTRVTNVQPGQLVGPTDAANAPRADAAWAAKPVTTGSSRKTAPSRVPAANP